MYKRGQLSLSAAGLLLSVSHCVQSSLSAVCQPTTVSVPPRTVVAQSAYYMLSVFQCIQSSLIAVCWSVSQCVQSSLNPPATVTVVQSSFSPPTTVSVPMRPVVTQSDYYSQCTDASSRPVSVTHSHAFSRSHKNLMLTATLNKY